MSPSLESSASQDLWSVMSGIVPQSVASSKPCALSLEIFTRGSVVWGNLLVSGVSLGVRLVGGGGIRNQDVVDARVPGGDNPVLYVS